MSRRANYRLMAIVRKLGANIGAEITDVNVKSLDGKAFEKIYQAWLNYGVTVVRAQDLTTEDFIAYGRRFGEIVPHPSKSTRHFKHPEITCLGINKFNPDGTLNEDIYKRGAIEFHTDGAYDEVPFKATKLYALAVPNVGGETHFSCMYMAYDALPKKLKTLLQDRRGGFTYGGRKGQNALLNPEDRDHAPVFHPLIRPHSETGRKALYFDPGKIVQIEGLEATESDDIIDELTERMIVSGAEYTHTWQVGDIVIWDNRCLVHKAAGNYPPQEDRIHWRLSIKESVSD